MKRNHKIKAGALQFVLFIGTVIALLLVSFVALSHTNSLFTKKTDLLIDTVKKADLGLDYALKHPPRFEDSLKITLGFDTNAALKVVREHWGVFEEYTAVSSSKKTRFVKSVLVGNQYISNRPALYLQDNQRPLIIVGQSEIIGDAFLPKQGIRPGNISGNSFYGASLVQGRQRQSRDRLPRFETNFRTYMASISQGNLSSNYDPVSLLPQMQLRNSFQDPTKLISGDQIWLSDVSLVGNIVVRATQRITVDANCTLRDVLLIAPEIILKNQVKGTLQAIASKRIEVGNQCELRYPSALALYKKTPEKTPRSQFQQPEIAIGSGTLLKGVVLYLDTPGDKQLFHPQISVDTNAQIWGEIYCERNLQLKGNVFGTVNTYGFIALENGSIYQNHLFNGSIDSEQLPQPYAGLPQAGNEYKKAISKWLY